MVALQVSVDPTVRDNSGLSDLAKNYPEVFKKLFGFGGAGFDHTSSAGYLGSELFSLMVPLPLIIAAVAGPVLLATGFGAIALLVGAAGGSRGAAIGIASALAVAAYLVNSLAALVSRLEPFQGLTPFSRYTSPDPLRDGAGWTHLGVLALIVAVAWAAALMTVGRRDPGT